MHNVKCLSSILSALLLLLALGLLNLFLVIIIEAACGHLVQSKNGLVGVLNKDELGVLGAAAEDHVGNSANDTPTVVKGQVHLVGEITRLPADNAQDHLAKISICCQQKDLPKLHDISAGEDALHCPSGKLAAVVLHLGSNNGTTLSNELASPVKSTTTSLSLAIELVEGVDTDVLVLAADSVLLDSINFRTDDEVDRLLLVGRQVETSVLVGLAGRGVGILGRVVEGVAVGHVDLCGFVLNNDLVGEVVVDVCGLLGEGVRLVDGVLAAISSIERSVGSVLVNCHHVKSSVVTLVKEDLVALSRDDNIPGIDGSRRAHEHGKNAVGSEDGVQEAVVVDVLTLVGVEVQLSQAVEVDLLEQLPLSLDVDASITVASRLVIVLPAEATTSTASVVAAASVVALSATSVGTAPLECGSSTSGTGLTSTLATATGKDGAATVS
ncbi:hypothetical protein HG531_013336 [Fusarium graminearum]|nr:hypothetical protein HG531_013336 [Fusarium graminearum]